MLWRPRAVSTHAVTPRRRPLILGTMRIGVDLGGTKIEAAAVEADGRVRLRRRVATPAGDYTATVATVRGLVQDVEATLGRRGSVGVGIPGTISPASGLVKNANSTWLIGRPLDRDLSEALARPVRVANDADCFALSEAMDGAARDAAIVFGVILGTGVGGGLVVNGAIVRGPNAISGEWGHNPLPWPARPERPGPRCYCGLQGCIETFLSGPALAADHARHAGETVEGPDLARRAADGDPAAEATLQRYEARLVRALAHVINVVDPEVIVLGGGLSHLSRLYDRVPARLPSWVFTDTVATVLRPPENGDSSGVLGAASLWGPRENQP